MLVIALFYEKCLLLTILDIYVFWPAFAFYDTFLTKEIAAILLLRHFHPS